MLLATPFFFFFSFIFLGKRTLTPGRSKSISQSLEILRPSLGDGAVNRVQPQGQITDEHGGSSRRSVEGVGIVFWTVDGFILKVASGALD